MEIMVLIDGAVGIFVYLLPMSKDTKMVPMRK